MHVCVCTCVLKCTCKWSPAVSVYWLLNRSLPYFSKQHLSVNPEFVMSSGLTDPQASGAGVACTHHHTWLFYVGASKARCSYLHSKCFPARAISPDPHRAILKWNCFEVYWGIGFGELCLINIGEKLYLSWIFEFVNDI